MIVGAIISLAIYGAAACGLGMTIARLIAANARGDREMPEPEPRGFNKEKFLENDDHMRESFGNEVRR